MDKKINRKEMFRIISDGLLTANTGASRSITSQACYAE